MNRNMSKREFAEKVLSEIPGYIPEEQRDEIVVKKTSEVKMNDTRLYGISFRKKGSDFGFGVCLDEMYEFYQRGEDFGELMQLLMEQCMEQLVPAAESIAGEGKIWERPYELGLRLVEIQRNRRYLENVPYWPVGAGMALLCDLVISDGESGVWRTTVTEGLLDEIGYDWEELVEKAIEEAQESDPPVMTAIKDRVVRGGKSKNLLSAGREKENMKERTEEEKVYVLSSESGCMGAAVLFYPGMQEKIGALLEEDYYVIPSSIHEVLIAPESADVYPGNLQYMVRDANCHVLKPKDVLSDEVFYYDREEKKLYTLPEMPPDLWDSQETASECAVQS